MMEKFAEFEQKLIVANSERDNTALVKQRDVKIVSEEKLSMIKETFNLQITGHEQDSEIGIKKIQELLLNFTDSSSKVSPQEIGDTLFMHF